MAELSKTYTPSEVEGAIYERWLAADVFAPDGAGSTADPALPPFTIIQPPPNVTGSLHLGHAQRTAVEDLMIRHARMRGPPGALPARARPREHRRPGRPRRHPRKGGGEPRLAWPRALPRADARLQRLDQAGHARAAAAGRWLLRLGPVAVHDGRGLGEGRPRGLRTPLSGRPRLPHGGPRQLVPRLPDQRERPRGRLDPRDRDALVGPLSPHRRRRPAHPIPDRDDHRGHHPTRDDPGRHGRCRPPGRRAIRGPGRASRSDPVRRARRADHRGRGRRSGLRDRRAEDHAGPRPRRSCRRPAPRPCRDHGPRRRRHDRRDRHAVRRPGPVRGSAPDRRRPRLDGRPGRVGPARDGHRPLPAQRRRHRAAPQDAVVHPDRRAGGACARGDPLRQDPDPAGTLREDLGTLDDRDPGLEREPPAVVGAPHPGLVLPRRPRDGVARPMAARMPARCAAGRRPTWSRTPTSSIPGSAPAYGRSRRSAGRTTRPTTAGSTRPRSWRPATTSSSSGSRG